MVLLACVLLLLVLCTYRAGIKGKCFASGSYLPKSCGRVPHLLAILLYNSLKYNYKPVAPSSPHLPPTFIPLHKQLTSYTHFSAYAVSRSPVLRPLQSDTIVRTTFKHTTASLPISDLTWASSKLSDQSQLGFAGKIDPIVFCCCWGEWYHLGWSTKSYNLSLSLALHLDTHMPLRLSSGAFKVYEVTKDKYYWRLHL